MESTKKTQCDMILDYMMEFGSITALQAISDLSCFRLASRIFDLRRKGVKINEKTVRVAKRMGGFTNISQYSLG
jgi:hypothetical protein